ncbi:MAG TPA: amidohydrolase family protein, partial [Pirellulales bacterium]
MRTTLISVLALSIALPCLAAAAEQPDLVLHNGKVVTVDRDFTIREALAVADGKIVAVGSNDEVLKHRGTKTTVVDLKGKVVLPGLGDSHVHPAGAAMTEFDHPVPDMESIADVLAYIKSRAAVVPEGQWIVVRQVFITRLREQRYPTKAELDEAAPRHPTVFSTGPDASANSLALAASGIDKNFPATGAGKIEKDPATGEPTGILRSATRYLKI